jgi:hypothetical protein
MRLAGLRSQLRLDMLCECNEARCQVVDKLPWCDGKGRPADGQNQQIGTIPVDQ